MLNCQTWTHKCRGPPCFLNYDRKLSHRRGNGLMPLTERQGHWRGEREDPGLWTRTTGDHCAPEGERRHWRDFSFPNFPSTALDHCCPQLPRARSWSLSLRKEGEAQGPLSRLLSLAQATLWAEQSCLGGGDHWEKGCMCAAAFVHKRWQGAGTPWRKAQFFPPCFCVEHRPPL